ncbi:hypothetical protein [Alteromonas sp. a30]|uniref:hypothetical protein n=1 Tax=Alteromonas sp. a30 TaxID=2730917 RepID=UPI00227FBD36|nr:hypothetical protein [Alteromonas sp. a30]MCY7296542.1 hypothetical protein [Alteromonas sp. a30]
MKTKFTVAAILLSTLGLTTQANANEVTLQYVVDKVVSQAANATANELSNNIYKAVVTAGLYLSSDEEAFETEVLISAVNNENKESSQTTE